jgi:HlyD family secretion protein
MKAKRMFPAVVALLVLGVFGSTLWFLWTKSRPKPAIVETGRPVVTDIVKKTVAAGSLQPRKEIEIKPKVAGILQRLFVEAGQRVKKGDLMAEVQIIPDVVNLNEAELRLRGAKLNEERLKRERDRVEALGARGAAAFAELDRLRSDHEMAQEEVRAAEMRVRLVREGAAARGKGATTRVEATVDGTVLAVLVREGSSVINANSFNPGTTIVSVADMSDIVFKGRVDESEVGRLREGMPVEIVVGALEERKFGGTLERIAPKSLAKEGATEFEIEAAFRPPSDVVVRAGYSANANIVLGRRERVLAIDEAFVQFDPADKDRRFVEVETTPGAWQTRDVRLGLSDGLKVEVLEGVRAEDVLKKPPLRASGAGP